MSATIFRTRSIGKLTFFWRRLVIAILWSILLSVMSACASEQTAPLHTATAMSSPSVTGTAECEQELIPPQIMEIQPAEPRLGSEINVIGSGGYVQDNCGGYIEGSKVFRVYLDHELIGDLSCYVNHCEGKFTLPATLSIGSHCLSVEIGTCQFEFQTIAQ